jgi:hypothetical protein
LGLGGEQHIVALAGGDMADGLGQMTLPGAAGAGNEDRDLLLDEAAGGE